MTKEVYQAPAMEVVGSFETITQSTNVGTTLDFAALQGQIPGQGNLS